MAMDQLLHLQMMFPFKPPFFHSFPGILQPRLRTPEGNPTSGWGWLKHHHHVVRLVPAPVQCHQLSRLRPRDTPPQQSTVRREPPWRHRKWRMVVELPILKMFKKQNDWFQAYLLKDSRVYRVHHSQCTPIYSNLMCWDTCIMIVFKYLIINLWRSLSGSIPKRKCGKKLLDLPQLWFWTRPRITQQSNCHVVNPIIRQFVQGKWTTPTGGFLSHGVPLNHKLEY